MPACLRLGKQAGFVNSPAYNFFIFIKVFIYLKRRLLTKTPPI